MRLLINLALVLALSLGAVAEQLWVSNKPFPGAVRGSGHEMLVEFQVLAELLEIEIEDQGENIVVGGFPLPVEVLQGTRFVHLHDFVDAARLKLSSNPALGTVDVRRASAGTGYKGDWNALSVDSSSSNPSKGTVTELAGEFFSVRVPARFKVVAEAEFLQSGDSENAKSMVFSQNDSSGVQTVCAIYAESEFKKGGLTLAFVPELPDKTTPKDELEILQAIQNEIQASGGQVHGSATTVNIAGIRFYRTRASHAEGKSIRETELNICFSNKHKVMVLFKIDAPKETFNRLAPQLRLVINSFRMK